LVLFPSCRISAALKLNTFFSRSVLTWISVYWFSRAGPAASLRIYYEFAQGEDGLRPITDGPTIPLGFSHFPKEVIRLPKRYVKLCP
jgi:hypothetical protein